MNESFAMEHDVVAVDQAAAAAAAADDHDDDDDDKQQKQSRFRLLDAARYVVAIVVMALTIAIVARAATVLTRQEELYLSIIGGYVPLHTITELSVPPKDGVHFHFGYSCYNPSGRAGIRYDGVNITFLYSNETEAFWIAADDGTIVVGPEVQRDVYMDFNLTLVEDLPMEFARLIYLGHEWKDMIVRFEGMLKTQVSFLVYSKGHHTKFLCPQVTIGNSTSYNDTTTANATCTLQSP